MSVMYISKQLSNVVYVLSTRTQEVSADVHVDADNHEQDALEIETMSSEFNAALKREKERLHLDLEKQMEKVRYARRRIVNKKIRTAADRYESINRFQTTL